jgi:hypothetical protein
MRPGWPTVPFNGTRTGRANLVSRFFVQQTRIGISVHTGRYGAYQTLFCDPLVRALKSAYLPGYRCTLSAGTLENILRVLKTLLWDEAGPECGIVLPIFISTSDTPGPYFFWPAAGAVAAIIAAQNAANAKSFVIVSPPYRASRQATESTPRLFGGALLLFDRFFCRNRRSWRFRFHGRALRRMTPAADP